MEPKFTINAKTLGMGLVVLALSLALFIFASVHPVYAASPCVKGAINKGGCAARDATCISDYCAANPDKGPKKPPDDDGALKDIMEEIMEEVREEVKRDIKKDVRRETSEVVAEEQLSPSGGLTGLYLGLIEDIPNACSLTFTNSLVDGTCNSSFAVITISGLAVDFTFQISRTDGCNDSGDGSLSVISGAGEPGTKLLLMLDMTSCNPEENDGILVKQ